MSQQVQVTLICDVPAHDTETPADRTVSIGLDGQDYELEVCAEHELQLLETARRYVEAARKVGSPSPRRTGLRTRRDRQHSRDIRAWALASGREVPERGRIPHAILRDYAAAQRGQAIPS